MKGWSGVKMVCESSLQQAAAGSDASNGLMRSSKRSDVDLSNPHSMRFSRVSFFVIKGDLPPYFYASINAASAALPIGTSPNSLPASIMVSQT